MTVTADELGGLPVQVTLDGTSRDRTMVQDYLRQGNALTLSTVDASTWGTRLASGTQVRVYGVGDGTGKLKAYYVNIYR
jgi:hypothetical protein